jgi:hypothetical protein
MNKVQDILYNVTGQTLYWDPPEGVPSSVTSATCYLIGTGDDGTTESATTGSASIDSVSTTFDAASGYGQSEPRQLNLASTSNIAKGAPYLAESATTGETEWHTVSRIVSNNYVYAVEPARLTYASSDTFKGTRISISVDSTWVADSSNITDDTSPNPGYRVRWVYVVDSVTYVHDGYFDLVRYPGTHSVTPQDMISVVPNWIDRLPTYHAEDGGQRLIDQAYENVKWDMHRAGHADEMIRHSGAIDRLVQLQAWAILERTGASEVQQALSIDAYNDELDGLVRVVTKIPEATDTSGAGADTTATAIWGK